MTGFLRGWLRPRSAGVKVKRVTFARIRRGDAARDRGDWAAAARAYGEAVAGEPSLRHIWVQYGHAAKESGDFACAEQAYRQAAALAPDDIEPLLSLGHMAKDGGARTAAARHFVDALGRMPDHPAAASELLRLLRDARADAALWRQALTRLGIDAAVTAEFAATAPVAAGSLLVDVSDLLNYLATARLPTGIQRVQIEVALAYLAADAPSDVTLCSYAAGDGGWVALPRERFERLCRASLISDDVSDPDWVRDVRMLYALLGLADPIRSAHNRVLVNLGTSWGDRSYLADVRAHQAQGLSYVSLVYDLIPVLHPHWFVPGLVRDYRRWLSALLGCADGYLAISAATRDDLIAVSGREGRPLAAERVRVVRIDGDFQGRKEALPFSRLAARGLAPGRFVLMVATIEPRKNHVGAFAAWLRLIAELGEDRVPTLVCVGGRGWLNEHVHAMLDSHPALARKVRLLSGVPDDELVLLYRACRFTLYPSLYEGWGLPVSESLGHGKVAAVSGTSSMPEAGGGFAVYFDPADPADIAARVRPLIVDDAALAAAEAAVRSGYRSRSWSVIAQQIADDARALGRASR